MSAIPRDQVEGIFALSPVQEGIFFHALADPERAPYVEQGVWRLQGEVQPDLVERAWRVLTARHAVLRTVFRQARRQPVQIVLRQMAIEIRHDDWSGGGSADDQRRRLRDLARAQRAPFALGDGPLFRLALVCLGPSDWRLVWTFHHVILDGLSVALLLESFCRIYDALASDEPLPEGEAPAFSRFLHWLSQRNRDEALRFWSAHLQGFEKPARVLPDRHSPAGATRTHRAASARVSPGTTAALTDIARQRRVTVATLVQAAWAILLARHSGEPDIVFGLTLAGRPTDLPGVEQIAGPFINTVPVRVTLTPDLRLHDLVQTLHRQRFDLEQHSHVSLADIQSRSAIAAPETLFDTALNVHPRVDWRGFRTRTFTLGVTGEDGPLIERTNYDLMVDVGFLDHMVITISFVEEVHHQATADAVVEGMCTLLDVIASRGADVRVAELSPLSPAARLHIVHELNRTDPPEPFDGGAVARIERQAARRPDATAVIDGETRLSFETLNGRANQIAAWLRAAGIGREDRVGLFGERCADWLTFALGILKAGAAFVPLDPMQPDERLAAIVSSAGLRVLACGSESSSRAAALIAAATPPHAPGLVCWTAACEGTAAEGAPPEDATPEDATSEDTAATSARAWVEMPATNLPRVTGPYDLACVFFTSGSTGAPKGVMVAHDGVMNHLAAKIATLAIDASSIVAQNASIGFDISVWQMFAALTVGGAVAIYRDEIAFDQPRLVSGIVRDEVTILETVPSLIDALIDAVADAPAGVPALRLLVSNAEFLPAPLCRRWLERFPGLPIVNTYGPTECSDDNTHHWQRGRPADDVTRVPIGRPIAGGRMYVLDPQLQLVPIGAPGQIAMGGIPVGRGYLDDPIKTAVAFVPDPFTTEPGARMYLSGDVGRWNSDGLLEWLRRDGDQIKVRGHRIELGEIQAALLRLPGVRQAVALIREDAKGEPRVDAYWVGDGAAEANEVRMALSAALPRYMVPSAIVRLEAFPMTSNGKLDRKALPLPPEDQQEAAFVPPAEGIEAAVAAIWSDVLGVERVGATENFFELGGQSLRTMQIRSRLSERFGVDIPLRAIFRHQTVREQARVVADALAVLAPAAAAIARRPDAETYPLSPAQRRLWIMSQLDPTDASYNLIAPLLLDGPLDTDALGLAWTALVARQDSLRTAFASVAGEPVQRVFPPGDGALGYRDLSGLSESARERAIDEILRDARGTPFTLDVPPVKTLLVTLAPQRHLLLLALHHLVSDGWSGDVLLRDLLALYRAARLGVEPKLPLLPIRYVDYAAWQNERLASGALAADEQYWRTQLAGELPPLDLPAPRDLPTSSDTKPDAAGSNATADTSGHTVSFSIDPETANRLRGAITDRDVTPFMLRLSLLKAWLATFTGAEDLAIGSPVAGRNRPETEGLIGFFVNLLTLRSSLSGNPTFTQIVDRVKRTCQEAYAHQEYPFDELVRLLNPARDTGRGPFFDVLFMNGAAGGTQTSDGLTVSVSPAIRERMTMRIAGAPVALLAACVEQPDGGLRWTLAFDGARVDGESAQHAAVRLEAFIRRVASHPKARLSALGALTNAAPPLRLARVRADETAPLALAQLDVWNRTWRGADRSFDGDGRTLAASTVRVAIDGALDEEAFVRGLRRTTAASEAFGLTFEVRDGRPVQRVGPPAEIPIEIELLTEMDPAAQVDRIDACERSLLGTAFDPDVAPLARAVLLRLAPARRVLVLAWQELIVDRYGIHALIDAAIDLARGGRLIPCAIGMTDVAIWQQERLASRALTAEANYWRTARGRATSCAQLPSRRSLVANGNIVPAATTAAVAVVAGATRVSGAEASTIVRPLSPDTTAALHQLARRLRTTPLRIVAAVASAWAARMTGQPDIALAVPMVARPRAASRTIGAFAHHVPIVVRVDGTQTVESLVADLSDRLSRAHAWRTFADSADAALAGPVDGNMPARPPVTMAVAWERLPERAFGNVRLRAEAVRSASTPYDLALTMVESRKAMGSDRLELQLTYAVDAFDADTIARWTASLEAGLTQAIDNVAQPVDRLDLLSASERDWILHELNATTVPYPSGSVHRLFEAQASARPEATALIGDGRTWTYAQLNRDANRLAHRLVELGVRPGALVATHLHRSPDLVIAFLAILKAGAAYLPIDVDEPAERIGLMLDEAKPALFVTTAELSARVPGEAAVRYLVLDRDVDFGDDTRSSDASASSTRADANLAVDGFGGSRAYVMHTSGSTGRPKGVMIPHRGIIRLVCNTNYAVFGADDVVGQMGKASFDASTIEIWAALLNGAALVVIPHDTMLSPPALSATLDAHGVTIAFATPAFFRQIAREAPRCFRQVKYLLVGGDVVSADAARRVLDSGGAPGRIVNVYGPTENTSLTTTHIIDRTVVDSGSMPIGRPIANSTVYIVDSELRLANVGMRGELLTGGEGLADGYLDRPDLTAERFVPDPFSGVPGARLYRTGDVASWRSDGAIEFHGRGDHQVKIRGHRIELGEIEALLLQHTAVADVRVVAREEAAGGRQLAAYVVPASGATIDPDALRRYASARMPAYMVPTWFVPLAALPLGRTGKVDRAALPPPTHAAGAGGAEDVAPRTPVEAEIAQVWREILGLPHVGLHDSFFDLGGDSLHCIVAVVRLGERGLRATPKQFYQHPTVAGLAACIEIGTPSVVHDAGPECGPMPLVPVQRSFFEQELPAAHHWNVGVLLRAERLDAAAVERALQAVLDHHDALRMRFTHVDGDWHQYNAAIGEPVTFDVIEVEDAAALTAECERLQASLDLTRGPLFRAALFRLPDGSDRLLVIEHHLVSDIASARTIVDDLARAYEQAIRGDEISLGPRTTSYRRWALALQAHAPDRLAELPYWQAIVEPGWPELPLDHDLGDNTIASSARVRVELDADETRILLGARQTLQMDVHDILLAALGRVLGGWTGARSVGLLAHAHGRGDIGGGIDLSRTVGWFTAMYPLRLDTGGDVDRRAHLERTRDMLARVPDDGIGYGLLRDMVRRPEFAGRAYPQVTFNYRGQFVPAASGSRFGVAQESAGALIAAEGPRQGILNVDCVAVRGRMNAVFVYSRNKHRAATIALLAERFAQELREVAALVNGTALCGATALAVEPAAQPASFADQAAGV